MTTLARAIRPLRRAEYDRLVAAGVFEGERVELIDGLVVTMAPHGPEHDGTIQILQEQLTRALGDRASVRVQSAFAALDDAEPEPDIAIVPRGDYRDAHPSRAMWIIEVAFSSVDRDREKAGVYARAGVPEYWIVDVARRVVEVHRRPSEGRYEETTTHRRGETLSPTAFPDVAVVLDGILR